MAKFPQLRVAACLIIFQAHAETPRPSDAAASSAVESARLVAATYIKQLPDFVCTETIRRYIQLTPKAWYPTDILGIKLTYASQTEERRLIEFNGHAADQAQESAGGLTNTGEFGGMIESLFDRATAAAFRWERRTTTRGRPAAVYSYRVDEAHSHYSLSVDPGGEPRGVIVAYHGTVAIDRQTGGVLRLTYEAESIPKDFPIQHASTAVDYGFVEVAGKRYLLPLTAVTETDAETATEASPSRNVAEFGDYRRFSTDSAVRFTGGEN